jgi:DNA-binding response OmpR family regulator
VTEENRNTQVQVRPLGPTPFGGTEPPFSSLIQVTRVQRKKDGKRILIVEDDHFTLAALEVIFGRYGFQVISASTVAEGLRLLDEDPDCVVLDLSLPDGLGIDILAQIRERKMEVCIAVTTGSVDPGLLDAAASLHPDVLLRKPVDAKRLLSTFGVRAN